MLSPLVFAHGFLGFKEIGKTAYFNNLDGHLKRRFPGRPVYFTQVDPGASIERRAGQIKAQIVQWLARPQLQPRQKALLIAHSMGGLDARFLISRLGGHEIIGALATIGSPHWGTPLADLAVKAKQHWPIVELEALIDARAWIHGERWLRDLVLPFEGGLAQMTPDAMERFNQETPQAGGVIYLAFAGAASPWAGGLMPPALQIPHHFISRYPHAKAGGPNDGLVAQASALGQGLGFDYAETVEADHFAQIGHSFSLIA